MLNCGSLFFFVDRSPTNRHRLIALPGRQEDLSTVRNFDI